MHNKTRSTHTILLIYLINIELYMSYICVNNNGSSSSSTSKQKQQQQQQQQQ